MSALTRREEQVLRNALAKAEQERDEARGAMVRAAKERDEGIAAARANIDGTRTRAEAAEAQRDAAMADNAAKQEAFERYVEERGLEHDDIPGTDIACPEDDTCTCPRIKALNDAFGPHPGSAQAHRQAEAEQHTKEVQQAYLSGATVTSAALMEQHREELERLSAALANILRTAENWGHGQDCAGDDDDEQDANCECGKTEILAILNPADGSLPGAAFLARRDALAKELKEAKKALVRARNDGLERAARLAESIGANAQDDIRALKEPEE